MKKISYYGVLAACMLLTSCATYHLSTQSLMEQFASSQTEKKINVLVAPPYFFFPGIVNGNNLRTIGVLDKHEQPQTLNVTRHMGVKITQNTGKHTIFYFDTLLLQDSTISGSKTHFFTAKIRPIKLANISKIELQK